MITMFVLFIKRTAWGRALQGVAQSRIGAQTAGIAVRGVDRLAFGLGCALSAAAGALLAPVYMVYPTCGSLSTMKGFEILIIGGVGSIPGSLVGGLLLAAAENIGAMAVSPIFYDMYGFIVLLVILAIKPTGLFGEKRREA
jgi:branched-chain amino acid transport system permease protein